MTLRRRLAASVPPIARRQQEIERLRAELRELKHGQKQQARAGKRPAATTPASGPAPSPTLDVDDYLSRPSFRRQLITLRRTTIDLRGLDLDFAHPLRQLPFKLRNYRFAASHGFAVPEVLRTWSDAADIDLAGLPDRFVVKSDGGAGSHGVLPLHRAADGGFTTADGARALTEAEVVEHFVRRSGEGRISGPFFAEEFLDQPGGGPIPDDVKVYVCYGEVQQVLLRRVAKHGDQKSQRRRYLAADGSDLGDVIEGTRMDPTIPVPAALPEITELARHLSLAVGLPFVRVDVYETDRGLVLGEVTRAPGGAQRIRADHDEAMGLAWERAAYRLDLDLQAGRPPGILHGTHPAPNLYPDGHVSTSAQPGPWEPRVVPCGRWCGQG